MTVDKILLDDDAISKIAAKILDKISGKQGVVCQGYYCDTEKEPDSSKQWNDVLVQNKLKFAETALARVASMPLTQDEIEQVAIELKTKKRTTDTISEEETDTAVRKVLADNVLISRAVQKKTKCIPSGPNQYCAPSSGYGINLHCAACGPNNNRQLHYITDDIRCVCGPNLSSNSNFSLNCNIGGPNSPKCTQCGPLLQVYHNIPCQHDLSFVPGIDPGDILRLSEQVALLTVEINKLKAMK
jgi:hypothetical protein